VDIQELSSRVSGLSLRFTVEDTDPFAPDSWVTYKSELADTHGAMDPESGIFTAPFSGFFAFTLYAKVPCSADRGVIIAFHNSAARPIFECDYYNDGVLFSSHAIHFSMRLEASDEVRIHSGTLGLASPVWSGSLVSF
jgi:hypothetical protein